MPTIFLMFKALQRIWQKFAEHRLRTTDLNREMLLVSDRGLHIPVFILNRRIRQRAVEDYHSTLGDFTSRLEQALMKYFLLHQNNSMALINSWRESETASTSWQVKIKGLRPKSNGWTSNVGSKMINTTEDLIYFQVLMELDVFAVSNLAWGTDLYQVFPVLVLALRWFNPSCMESYSM